jgi:hypothetical protein
MKRVVIDVRAAQGLVVKIDMLETSTTFFFLGRGAFGKGPDFARLGRFFSFLAVYSRPRLAQQDLAFRPILEVRRFLIQIVAVSMR